MSTSSHSARLFWHIYWSVSCSQTPITGARKRYIVPSIAMVRSQVWRIAKYAQPSLLDFVFVFFADWRCNHYQQKRQWWPSWHRITSSTWRVTRSVNDSSIHKWMRKDRWVSSIRINLTWSLALEWLMWPNCSLLRSIVKVVALATTRTKFTTQEAESTQKSQISEKSVNCHNYLLKFEEIDQ